MGPPGSGKGTQADKLAGEIGLPVISVGDLFRKEVGQGTEIGRLVEKKMSKGELIDTEITDSLLSKRLKEDDAENGFILDGYPRKKDQIDYADKLISEVAFEGGDIFVFYIDVDDDEVKKRIAGRRVCSCGENFHLEYRPPEKEGVCDACGEKLRQRNDDTEEAVAERLDIFHQENSPVVEHFSDKAYFYRINGRRGVEDIKNEIVNIIKNN